MKPLNRFLILCLWTVISASTLLAQAPRTFSYQGSLLDAAKKPVSGVHHLTLKLYDAPVEGNLLHAENFISQIENGIFSVMLGSETTLESAVTFDKPYWLGVSIDDNSELLPRTALTSIPHAIHADAASSLAKGAKGAVTSLNGKSGDLKIKGGAGTDVHTEGNTITITAVPITSTGDIKTQTTTVNAIIGTANQVLANGTSGSQQSGNLTLTTPQNINTGASPTFNGMTLSSFGTAGLIHNNGSGALSSSLLVNNDVSSSANIAYSKLNLTGSIVNADIATGANIAASKLNLTNAISSGDIVAGTIVNSDISATANIASSKLNLANAITSGDIVAGTIINTDVNASANIAYSKLNLSGSIVNADIAAGASIVGSKLNLTNAINSGDIAAGTIVNSDVSSAANIAYSKLNLTGNIINADIAGGAAIAYAKLNLTGSVNNADIATGANVVYSKLNLTGSIVNADIATGANIASNKLNLTNAISSGDIVAGTIVNSDVNGAANIAYSKLNLTGSIVNTDIAGSAAIADTKLATISAAGKVANSATTATSSNTNSTIVLRNGSGNFSAGTITANLTGNASGTASSVTGIVTEVHGGTNQSTYSSGDILYASAGNTLSKLGIGSESNILTVSEGFPAWHSLAPTDMNAVAWTLSGNAGTNSAINFIGTTDNSDFVMKTNGIEQLRIAADGTSIFTGNTSANSTVVQNWDGAIVLGGSSSYSNSFVPWWASTLPNNK